MVHVANYLQVAPGSLPDRLGAALEAIVISDRWVAHGRSKTIGPAPSWQEGLLRVAHACTQGDSLLPQRWQTHFQALPDRAAVLINVFPYLWLQADAQGHHRAAVGRWVSALGRSVATAEACEALFSLVCQEMKVAGSGAGASLARAALKAGNEPPLEPALRLMVQSQGQLAVVLDVAYGRGWTPTEVALAGLLVGLTEGRSGVGAGLRQRWLRWGADGEQGRYPDGWQGLKSDDLAAIAAGLHCRWAGGETGIALGSSPFPWGIRV